MNECKLQYEWAQVGGGCHITPEAVNQSMRTWRTHVCRPYPQLHQN